ncbi:MAG: phytanoyl-CoA dioxygenase family protein [Sphingobacteriales bacterium]|nr:phytanoyl-CoA dioxygenase family protein [Sphingobacteriales bacterium]
MSAILQTSFRLEDQVTDKQAEFFRKNGVIHFKNFIDPGTVKLYLAEISRVENYLLENGVNKVNGIPLKFGLDVNGSAIIQRLAFTSRYSEILSEFLRSDKLRLLVKLLEPYSGRISETEKDGLVVNHYLNTENSQYTRLGWHTDSPRDLFLGSRILPMLNVGLHLDDCPVSNGGLKVLPGTHNKGWFTLFFRKKYFVDNKKDKNEIGLDIEAGDLTVHDGRLWHRVEQSPVTGERSRRRVMYIPVITGAYKPKTASSPTPFYHRVSQFKLYKFDRKKRTPLAEEKPAAGLAVE